MASEVTNLDSIIENVREAYSKAKPGTEESSAILNDLQRLYKIRDEEIDRRQKEDAAIDARQAKEAELDLKERTLDCDKVYHDLEIDLKTQTLALEEAHRKAELEQKAKDRKIDIGLRVGEFVLTMGYLGWWVTRSLIFEETGSYSATTAKEVTKHSLQHMMRQLK